MPGLSPRATRVRAVGFGNRFMRLALGLVLCALGISAIIRADLGVGPWDVLHQGIARRTGLSFGLVAILVGFVVLGLWIPLRQRFGIGTVFNMVVMGVLLDMVLPRVPEPSALAPRAAMLLGGMAVLGVGVSLYIGSGLGAGPRDGIMTGLHARGVSIVTARTAIEVTVLVVGWLLGGTVGPGTVVFAFGIGPLVHQTIRWFELPPRPPRASRAGALASAA